MDAPEFSSIATALMVVFSIVDFPQSIIHQSILAALYRPGLPALGI
jgi:hypothetical protein